MDGWMYGWMNERQLELIGDNVDEESNVARALQFCFEFKLQRSCDCVGVIMS